MKEPAQVSGFKPLADAAAQVLVLGTMPSVASLQASQYYGHPRNAFWPLMAELLGFEPELSYALRAQAVRQRGLAIWDVLQSCQRPGSLDSEIQNGSEVVNDFEGFFEAHPRIQVLVFNGRKSEQLYRRHALPRLRNTSSAAPPGASGLPVLSMPSTSPAMASLDFAGKKKRWKQILDWLSPEA
jgi:double-stranded uracil-DNA glycosylase